MPIPKTLSGLRILVIDDEPSNRDVISQALMLHDAKAQSVDSAATALAILNDGPRFTVILTDLSMSGTDGWSFHRTLRQRADTRDRPIIALTAHAMEGDRERVMAAGFDGYISKPIDIMTFDLRVLECLPLHHRNVGMVGPTEDAPADEHEHAKALATSLRRRGATISAWPTEDMTPGTLICYQRPEPTAYQDWLKGTIGDAPTVFSLKTLDMPGIGNLHFETVQTSLRVADQITATLVNKRVVPTVKENANAQPTT